MNKEVEALVEASERVVSHLPGDGVFYWSGFAEDMQALRVVLDRVSAPVEPTGLNHTAGFYRNLLEKAEAELETVRCERDELRARVHAEEQRAGENFLKYQDAARERDEYEGRYNAERTWAREVCSWLAACRSDSENKSAEPYGLAETEALLKGVDECHHDGGCRAHKQAEALRNSRGK